MNFDHELASIGKVIKLLQKKIDTFEGMELNNYRFENLCYRYSW